MNQYVTGAAIKRFREKKNLTQSELAEIIAVSDKAVSRWETGRGYPDITLLEPLAAALGVSVTELLSGEDIVNGNRSSNMLRSKLYVCPVCGNIIHSMGEAVISCCGITLFPLETEEENEDHALCVEKVEDEYYVTLNHEMTKEHFISFIGARSDDGFQFVKCYPEGNAEARFKRSRVRSFYYYCNRHGLFKVKAPKRK